MWDEDRADFEAQIKRARAEGLAEGRALERAEMNEKLKNIAADSAEKLHTVKCSLLKIKVRLYRAERRASRDLHVQHRLGRSGEASRSRLSCRKGPSRGAHGRSRTMWYRSAETSTGSVNSP